MSLFDKALDKMGKYNSTYLTYDKLLEFVEKEFIEGADAQRIAEITNTVKGGIATKSIDSLDGKYTLSVSSTTNFSNITAIFAPKRDVMIWEKDTKNYIQLDRSKDYKKFCKALMAKTKK